METEKEVTKKGNPSKPEGDYGRRMLDRMNRSHEVVTNWGLDKFILDKPERILDIGCGGGATMGRLSSRYPEAKIYGLDYSEVSVEKSIEFNREAVEAGKMEVTHGSVESIPFEDNMFDGITTVESFCFWPSHLENIKEVKRVLKPGGVFMIIADLFDDGLFDEELKSDVEEYGMFVPVPGELEKMFEEAGYRDINEYIVIENRWLCIKGRK